MILLPATSSTIIEVELRGSNSLIPSSQEGEQAISLVSFICPRSNGAIVQGLPSDEKPDSLVHPPLDESNRAEDTIGPQSLSAVRSDIQRDDDSLSMVERNGTASILLYKECGRKADLDSGINHYRVLLQRTLPDHPELPSRQALLCEALCEYVDLWGGEDLLVEALQLGEACIERTRRADMKYNCRLCAYARAICLGQELKGQTFDVTRALGLLEALQALDPEQCASSAVFLMAYGRVLFHQFEGHTQLDSLEGAIASYNSALFLMEDNRREKPHCLSYLASAYMSRFNRLHNASDISNRIEASKRAVALCRPDDPRRPRYLSSLCIAVHRQWIMISGDSQALDESIFNCKEALNATDPGDRTYSIICSCLSIALLDRYELGGNLADLNECVRLSELALQSQSLLSSNGPAYCYNLSRSLRKRFRDTAHAPDIDRAILLLQEQQTRVPKSSSNHAHVVGMLSTCLLQRYYILKQSSDLLAALDLCRTVVEVLPTHGSYLANVGECFLSLYQHHGDASHLDASIEWMERAQQNLKSVGQKCDFYISFGDALAARAKASQNVSHWDHAVQQFQCAVQHTQEGHKARSQALRKLGAALKGRFEDRHGADAGDITEALSILERTLREHAASFESARCATALGDALRTFYNHYGGDEYLVSALRHFRGAAEDDGSFIRDRFVAALNWASLAEQQHRHDAVYRAHSLAVELLPRVVWLGFHKDVRVKELRRQAGSLAVDAAAAAIELGLFERAVELLESGRGVFWSQLLQLRTEVDELHEVAPSLAAELQEVGQALELDVGQEMETEALRQRQRRLAERWEQLVSEVRMVNGFQNFLQFPTFSQLSSAAKEGPVLIVNCSRLRCDALIITSDSRILHCPLLAVKAEMVSQRSDLLARTLKITRDRSGRSFTERTIIRILDWLWHNVVLSVWNMIKGYYPHHIPRRMWLCPTGHFALLPLHAAMPYRSSGAELGFPDLIACSYTATLSALIRARSPKPTSEFEAAHPPRLLAVNQPATPGYDPLIFSSEEMCIIESFQDSTTFISGQEATILRVYKAMQKHNWIHFACHGSSRVDSPLESCFHFEDGPLSVSTIAGLRLPDADFAFLSACHTAQNSTCLPDESLNLVSALQLAGFKSIVGTQWDIADKDAPEVTSRVYGHMTNDGKNHYTSAAEGLHKATTALRRRGVPAHRWVPFIHIGV